jgi:ubiquinone/menaquinone biosynthesis C-methylase UbiE
MRADPRAFTMKNYLYKLVIYNVTDLCYNNCLNYFPSGSRILDVGIGNGMMLRNYHGLIKSKNFSIVGIDINKDYLSHCSSLIRDCRLEDHIQIFHEPVECYEPPEKGYFDYILFSMSFMLFSDQELVLDRVRKWLKPGGKILFFQTMFQNRSLFMEFIKPKLKYVTTVDFGRVTYDDGFFDLLRKKKLNIDEDRLIKKEWFKGEYRLIISSPGNGKVMESALRSAPGIRPAFLEPVPSGKAERKSKII